MLEFRTWFKNDRELTPTHLFLLFTFKNEIIKYVDVDASEFFQGDKI